MTATAYADIRCRLAEATGPLDDVAAHDLASAVFRPAFTPEWYLLEAALRGSLDAAIALVEQKLPGWGIEQISWSHDIGGPVIASVGNRGHGEAYRGFLSDDAATPALAVLSALFAALEPAHD